MVNKVQELTIALFAEAEATTIELFGNIADWLLCNPNAGWKGTHMSFDYSATDQDYSY